MPDHPKGADNAPAIHDDRPRGGPDVPPVHLSVPPPGAGRDQDHRSSHRGHAGAGAAQCTNDGRRAQAGRTGPGRPGLAADRPVTATTRPPCATAGGAGAAGQEADRRTHGHGPRRRGTGKPAPKSRNCLRWGSQPVAAARLRRHMINVAGDGVPPADRTTTLPPMPLPVTAVTRTASPAARARAGAGRHQSRRPAHRDHRRSRRCRRGGS